jgi:type III pantothenate kinase
MKPVLIIDVGNSYFKAAAFDKQKVIKTLRDRLGDIEGIEESLVKLAALQPQAVFISSVNKKSTVIEQYFKRMNVQVVEFTSSTPLFFLNRYETPETLGKDRLANAAAAVALFPGKPVLVLDAGTCLKYDFINVDGEYLGGSISPGIEMRFRALHQFTSKLPLIKREEYAPLTGRNTTQAIQSGVLNGFLAEAKGIIGQYQMVHKNLQVVLTGGDYLFLERELKITTVADPYFTIKGLYEIYKHSNP